MWGPTKNGELTLGPHIESHSLRVVCSSDTYPEAWAPHFLFRNHNHATLIARLGLPFRISLTVSTTEAHLLIVQLL